MKSCVRLNSRTLPTFNALSLYRNDSFRWFSLTCKQCFVNSELLVFVFKQNKTKQNNSNKKILPSMLPKESPEFCLMSQGTGDLWSGYEGQPETSECARPQFFASFSQYPELPLSLLPLQTLAQTTISPHPRQLNFHYYGSKWAFIIFTLLSTLCVLSILRSQFF